MILSRREVIKFSGSAAATVGFNPNLFQENRLLKAKVDPDLLDHSDILAIAKRTVDTAVSLGASYADVRIIRRVSESIGMGGSSIQNGGSGHSEIIGIGVRVLFRGAIGFAASPFIDNDEAEVLAKSAVEQAREFARVRPQEVEWIAMPKQQGRWVSPGKDPFVIPIEEKVDIINACREEIKDYRDGIHKVFLDQCQIRIERFEKFMANSEGSEISQVLYFFEGAQSLGACLRKDHDFSFAGAKGLDPQQGGWEVFEKANIRKQIPDMVERAMSQSKIGVVPVDIGRYDLVLAGSFAGELVASTFGQSTQLDTVIGYEANAGGTSYLGPDPNQSLGTQVASNSISIRCDRSGVGKLATVKWDDEGVEPQAFDLVRDGVLVDYQTSRNTAPLLKAWYTNKGMNAAPRGCISTRDGLEFPMQFTPNLELVPSSASNSLEEMISKVKKGYVVYSGDVNMSFNVGDGLGSGLVREIRNGIVGDEVINFAMMFSAPEIWKSVISLGDKTTVERIRSWSAKGQPSQSAPTSVDAPALLVKDVAVIDPTRKA